MLLKGQLYIHLYILCVYTYIYILLVNFLFTSLAHFSVKFILFSHNSEKFFIYEAINLGL